MEIASQRRVSALFTAPAALLTRSVSREAARLLTLLEQQTLLWSVLRPGESLQRCT